MLLKILIIVASAALIAFIGIKIKLRRENIEKMYRSAATVLKNEYIDSSLKKPMLSGAPQDISGKRKPMIYFRVMGSKPLQEYVFDPEKGIGIGRSRENNAIILSEAIVSLRHCMVYAVGGEIYLEDVGSANGTLLKRGLRSFVVGPGQQAQLLNNDRIVVGTTEFKIRIFDFDMVWM